jgi:Tfp pilus assembly protein PilF
VRVVAIGLGLLAFVVRAFYLIESAGNPFRRHLILDSAFYDAWARGLAAGKGFGDGPYLQAPLYPYFLAGVYAIFGAHPGAALWIQALLGAATVTLAALVAGRMWGRGGAIAAGLLLALYRPGIFYTGVLLVPILATFVLALALCLVPRRPLLAGICTGAAGLAHPLALPGGLVALIGVLWAERGPSAPGASTWRALRRPALMALLGTALGIAPATIHNLVTAGAFVPIATNSGLNFFIGNGPSASGYFTPPPGLGRDEDLYGIREASRLAGRELKPAAASQFWSDRATAALRAQPGRAALLFLRKVYLFLNAYETPQVESLDFEKRYSLALRVPFLPGWALLAALAAAAVYLRRRDRFTLTMIAAVGATALATALFFVTARFRLPAHLYLALAAAGGLVALARTPLAQRARWVKALGAAFVTILLLVPNWAGVASTRTFGNAHLQLGLIAEQEGRAVDAQREYAEALKIDPGLSRAAINLGILTARGGDLDHAQPLLEQGVTLDPRSARGFLALGQIREMRGDLAGACSLYARAWEADSTFTKSLESLAIATYLNGDVARAESLARDLVRRIGPRDPLGGRCTLVLARIDERRRYGWPLRTSAARAEGDVAFAERDLPRAEAAYQRAAAESPGDLAALLELVRVAAARDDAVTRAARTAQFVQAGGSGEMAARAAP